MPSDTGLRTCGCVGAEPVAKAGAFTSARPSTPPEGEQSARAVSFTPAHATEHYAIEMWQRADGTDVAAIAWNGRKFTYASRNGAHVAVARAACAAGASDGPWVVVAPGQSLPRLYGRSLHALARQTISEGEARPRVIAWRNRPVFGEAAE